MRLPQRPYRKPYLVHKFGGKRDRLDVGSMLHHVNTFCAAIGFRAMNRKIRIAFYAPLKPPDHPIASGDRQMARMLLAALQEAGYDAFLASRYISYSKRFDAEHLQARKQGAHSEAQRLLALWKENGNPPDLWFCYHPYDKSPDWLGMEICEALSIPMVTAEPCKTGQGPNGEWLPWRAEAQRGIKMAAINIVMTPSDLAYVSEFLPVEKIVRLEPFIASQLLAGEIHEDPWQCTGETVKLLSVGMMRAGAKLDSYTMLSNALRELKNMDWKLVVAGDGPGSETVQELFSWSQSKRVELLGEVEEGRVLSLMRQADTLAWPGCREAYGMVYLEAASRALPAVALDNMGVPLVVRHERTGLLATPPDVEHYTKQLRRMIEDKRLRAQLAKNALAFVREERSLDYAATRLRAIIDSVLEASI